MEPARSRSQESDQQALIVRIPSAGVDGVRNGYVCIDVFSFESDHPIPAGTRLFIQYRIAGTAMWVASRAMVIGCAPGPDSVLVQGRLVNEFRSGARGF